MLHWQVSQKLTVYDKNAPNETCDNSEGIKLSEMSIFSSIKFNMLQFWL